MSLSNITSANLSSSLPITLVEIQKNQVVHLNGENSIYFDVNSRLYQAPDGSIQLKEKSVGFIIGERVLSPLVDSVASLSEKFFNLMKSIDKALTFPGAYASIAPKKHDNDKSSSSKDKSSSNEKKTSGSIGTDGRTVSGSVSHGNSKSRTTVSGGYDTKNDRGSVNVEVSGSNKGSSYSASIGHNSARGGADIGGSFSVGNSKGSASVRGSHNTKTGESRVELSFEKEL